MAGERLDNAFNVTSECTEGYLNFFKDGDYEAFLLREERGEEMDRFNAMLAIVICNVLGALDCLLGFGSEVIGNHREKGICVGT
jgi:hypothetical protein